MSRLVVCEIHKKGQAESKTMPEGITTDNFGDDHSI